MLNASTILLIELIWSAFLTELEHWPCWEEINSPCSARLQEKQTPRKKGEIMLSSMCLIHSYHAILWYSLGFGLGDEILKCDTYLANQMNAPKSTFLLNCLRKVVFCLSRHFLMSK